MFSRKKDRVFRGPRIIWWLPCVSDLEIITVVRQVVDLEPQTLMTKDGKPVVAGAVVVYTIEDVSRYLIENHDAERSVAEVAGAALRESIVVRPLAEIQENERKKVDNALTRTAGDHLAEFGILVERMRLTDFSTAQIMNYVGVAPFAPYTETED